MDTVDFETKAIVFGSGLAPEPVGVSIRKNGVGRYYAFGHPTNNNCTVEEAKAALREVWKPGLLFHNGKFDMSVAVEHWGFEWLDDYNDTTFLVYLFNPHGQMSLKPAAHQLLGIPPDEQEEVRDWLVSHGIIPSNTKDWGAHIWRAPGDLVGKYANGDTFRTEMLYEFLIDKVKGRGMEDPYRREIELSKYLYEAEFRGVPINRDKLIADIPLYEAMLVQCDLAISARLGNMPIETPHQLATALVAAGYPLRKTPTGRISTSQDALQEAIRDDKDLLDLLAYRGACKTLLGTFMKPWVAFSARDGRLHPSWNQVRGERYGTKTGRLSCSTPNLQNVPTEFEFDYHGILAGFAPLPFMREYIMPEPGEVLVAADFNGQEMRLLAHFAEGKAAEIYRDNPRADFHQIAVTLVEATSGNIWSSQDPTKKRKQAKITGFSLIYGAGVPALAAQLGIPGHEAAKIKTAYLKAIPGLKDFQKDVSSRPEVKTWGGRWIPVEPAKANEDGSVWTFEYKLVNHLIQGSASDQTKESIVQYHRRKHRGRFMMTVHDENVISVSLEALLGDCQALAYAMEQLPGFDVPFIVEFEYGSNWHHLTSYEFERLQ